MKANKTQVLQVLYKSLKTTIAGLLDHNFYKFRATALLIFKNRYPFHQISYALMKIFHKQVPFFHKFFTMPTRFSYIYRFVFFIKYLICIIIIIIWTIIWCISVTIIVSVWLLAYLLIYIVEVWFTVNKDSICNWQEFIQHYQLLSNKCLRGACTFFFFFFFFCVLVINTRYSTLQKMCYHINSYHW